MNRSTISKSVPLFLLIFLSFRVCFAQKILHNQPLATTYSIVAFDENTGEMGVAVQSHWFSVGSLVSWGEAGVGVIATQSLVNPAFGTEGLALLKEGLSPKEVVEELILSDEGRDFRQLAVLDANGQVAAYTGDKCIEAAGHIEGDGYSVQANMMVGDAVWALMNKIMESTKGQPLEERLLLAMEAAEAIGGDIRGKQSAAMLIVRPKATGQPWVDKRVDLRVEDHPNPVQEMRRLLKLHRAYAHMSEGDIAIEKGDIEGANKAYGAAKALFPDNLEMQYWHAIALTNVGKTEEALPIFQKIFKKSPNWRTLTARLIPNGILQADEATLKRIIELPSQ